MPICAVCDRPSLDECPRCERPICAHHGAAAEQQSWPQSGYNRQQLCPDCARASTRHTRLAARVSVAASAALVGMAVGAFATMVIGGVLGLGTDVIVVTMLAAELGLGGASAYAADKHVQRYLLRRDQRRLDTDLPKARLLEN